MKNLLRGLTVLPFLAGIAVAGQVPLSDAQLDKATAGMVVTPTNAPATPCCSFCFSTISSVAVVGYRLTEL